MLEERNGDATNGVSTVEDISMALRTEEEDKDLVLEESNGDATDDVSTVEEYSIRLKCDVESTKLPSEAVTVAATVMVGEFRSPEKYWSVT